MTETYFFDTYAFFELIYGNPNYKKFEDIMAITSIFNLVELNFSMKKDFSELTADRYTDEYWKYLVDITSEDVKIAMSLRKKFKHKNLSAPDAIGYTVAKRLGIKFLTGDKSFKDLENVEFVKR